MLCELHITNFAIVEEQVISFGPGLNVISGETGAGKFIVLQALDLILGGRAKPRYIRSGSESWEIQALFDLSNVPEQSLQQLPDIARADELVVSRSMTRNGRGKVYINGRVGTVALLEEITQPLIDVCSQGYQTRLLNPTFHLELVDGFAGHDSLIEKYQRDYEGWSAANRRLTQARERAESNHLRRAELEFIVEELEAAKLHEGKRAELEGGISRMANAEQLLQLGDQMLQSLTADRGAFDVFGKTGSELEQMVRLDSGVREMAELFESARTNLQEFEAELNSYVSAVQVNEEGLESQREDLAELARLERKYRTDEAGLCRLLEQAGAELEEIAADEDIEALVADVAVKQGEISKSAEALSRSRQKAGQRLTKDVSDDLAQLNMKDARLSVNIQDKSFGPDGKDELELCIMTNRGEVSRPLREIASGGELSRIMLVLKKVLQERSGVNVLVFDEVDTGVSGGVARAVGGMLRELAAGSQVLCITHLAQVASLADRHFLVDKQSGKRTVSVIRELAPDDQVEEIARMIAGLKVTEAARASARELLSFKS